MSESQDIDTKTLNSTYVKKYQTSNREAYLESKAKYRENNKEKLKEARRVHYLKNKETILIKNKASREAKKQIEINKLTDKLMEDY